MSSQSNSTNFAMPSGTGKSSQEEARRKHLLSLHNNKRQRFRTRVPVQEEPEEVNSIPSNSAYGREDQASLKL